MFSHLAKGIPSETSRITVSGPPDEGAVANHLTKKNKGGRKIKIIKIFKIIKIIKIIKIGLGHLAWAGGHGRS